MILAINTAQQVHELALISENKLLMEHNWKSEKNDLEKLVPTLQSMLDELGVDKTELTEILVVRGPGPFTAVRTGLAFANALAAGLGTKLYAMDSFELLKWKVASPHPLLILLPAGGLNVALWHDEQITVGPLSSLLADFEHHRYQVVSELKETLEDELHSICLEKGWKQVKGHELQSLGEAILSFGLKTLEAVPVADAYYLKGPKITLSKDPWKQA